MIPKVFMEIYNLELINCDRDYNCLSFYFSFSQLLASISPSQDGWLEKVEIPIIEKSKIQKS
jgi:hypothetical protein